MAAKARFGKYEVAFVGGTGAQLAAAQVECIEALDKDGYDWQGFASTMEHGSTDGVLLYFKLREPKEQVNAAMRDVIANKPRAERRRERMGRS